MSSVIKVCSTSLILLASVVVLFKPGRALAGDGTWTNNAAGSWSVGNNWLSGTVADGADGTATLGDVTANCTITLDTVRTIGNITSADTTHNYTISGANALTLDVTAGSPAIDVPSGRTLTISSQISGNDGLTKNGAGILTLSSSNDYSGGTVFNGGQVNFNQDYHLGDPAGSLTFSGATVYLSSGSTVYSMRTVVVNPAANVIKLQGNGHWHLGGPVTGTGGILFLGNPNGGISAHLTNLNNTVTGELGLNSGSGGTLTVELASLLDGAGYGNIYFMPSSQQSYFLWGAAATNALVLDNRQIEFRGDGTTQATIQNNNTSTSCGIIINTDLLVPGTGAKTLTLGGANTGTNQFAGNITDEAGAVVGVVKTAAGRWALAGTNTYSGDTSLLASGTTGELILQGTNSLSPNTKLVFAQNSSNRQRARFLDDGAGTNNFNRPIEFGGGNTSQILGLFIGNNNTDNGGNSSGTTTGSTIQIGDITFTSVAGDTSTTSIDLTGANNYRLATGIITLNNLVSRNAGNVTTTKLNPTTASITVGSVTMAAGNQGRTVDGIPVLNLDGTASDNYVLGAISDATDAQPSGAGEPLSLTKSNTSQWTLTGTNTYSGGTTVSAGTLFANSTNALGVGNVTISGGTLEINSENAMTNTASLYVSGSGALTLNENLAVAKLFVGGVAQPNGTYTSSESWISGTGSLKVGPDLLYWDPDGDANPGVNTSTPDGTWNDSNSFWNNAAGQGAAGTWASGRTAVFSGGTDATGDYTVTLTETTKDVGGLTFEEGNATLTGATALRMTADTVAYVANAGQTATVATVISEDATSRALSKSGAGKLVLSGANTYSGPTTLSEGTLQLTDANAVAASSDLIINAGTLIRDTALNLSNLTVTTTGYTFDGNKLSFAGEAKVDLAASSAVTTTFTCGIDGAPEIRIGSYADTKHVRFEPDGSTTQSLGKIVHPYYNSNNLDKGSLHLGGTSSNNTIEQITYENTDPDTGLSKNSWYGYMYKEGTGKWTINGDICQGKLYVNAGTFVLNGAFSSLYNGMFPIASGATLSGTGSVDNNQSAQSYKLTVSSGAILAPGNPTGIFTVTNSSCKIDGTLAISFSGDQCSRLSVDGDLDISAGTSTLDVNTAGASGSEFIIATFDSLTGSAFAATNNLPSSWQVVYEATQIKLVAPPGGTVFMFK